MTDIHRLSARIDDLTRKLADLEAEHRALKEDHRLLKMRVEGVEECEHNEISKEILEYAAKATDPDEHMRLLFWGRCVASLERIVSALSRRIARMEGEPK